MKLIALTIGTMTMGALMLSAQQTTPSRPVFRAEAELVALTVTVQRSDGSYVTGLQPDAFTVFEEGVPQKIAFFDAGEVPLDLILMLDTSASMNARLPTIRKAAARLVRTLGPADRAAIITFGPRTEFARSMTNDRAALDRTIRQLSSAGSTGLYNALYVALTEVGSTLQQTEIRRRALVLLSDGEDTTSLVSFESVLEMARRVGVAIYTVSLRAKEDPRRTAWRSEAAAYEMRTLARETGAKSFFPSKVEDIETVYAAVAGDLAHQYALGYLPDRSAEPGRFRRVAVSVQRPNITVRARSGYVAGS